jgi:hypothetical protein
MGLLYFKNPKVALDFINEGASATITGYALENISSNTYDIVAIVGGN